jgi:putative ABC transport system permease protein
MTQVSQWAAASILFLRSLPARFGAAMVIIGGVAVVAAVLSTTLAIATGFTSAAARTGRADVAIILHDGASVEGDSTLSREEALAVLDARSVRRDGAGRPVASVEALEFIPVIDESTGRNAFVTLRGVGLQHSALRPGIRIISGRSFQPGAAEIIVGRALLERHGTLAPGSVMTLPNGDWTIVGVFDSSGDSHESELLADADTMLAAYRSNRFNSVTVALASGTDADRLSAELASRTGLAVHAIREDVYYTKAAEPVSRLLTIIAYGLGSIMALGAAFGALNTMYSSVSSRATEIVTLRIIGFDSSAVMLAVLAEALVLALLGALAGTIAVALALHGSMISTLTGVTPSQMVFPVSISPSIGLTAAAFACGIGMVGGLFAATRAVRLPLSAATRAA